jgi:glycosyltransferase involved in cell wall biosynthesis
MKTISIITVVYNGADVIKSTLTSVCCQTYEGIEYLIIDGASTDKTVELAKSAGCADQILSEPDKGIYDAMNKGLKMATSDYVLFLNAGDCLIDNEVIANIMALPDADVYYGETMLINDSGMHLGKRSDMTTRKLPRNLSWRSLKKGLVVSHQSIIIRKSIAPSYISDNLSADIDWVISCLKKAKSVIRYDGIISEFLVGGISDQQHWKSLKDRFRVFVKHFGFIEASLRHVLFIFRHLIFKLRPKR